MKEETMRIFGAIACSADPGYDGGAPAIWLPQEDGMQIDLIFLSYENSITAMRYGQEINEGPLEELGGGKVRWTRGELRAAAEALAAIGGAKNIRGVAACVDQLAIWHGWYRGSDLLEAEAALLEEVTT